MKKIISLILCFVMLLPTLYLCSCTEITPTKSTENKDEYYDDEPDDTPKMASMYIETRESKDVYSKDEYLFCCVSLTNCKSEYSFDSINAGIRFRGNSTSNKGDPYYAEYNQVPYRIKFEEKRSVLGLNDGAKCKSWVLLLPNPNNVMALSLSKKILGEDGYYSSDYSFINLYINFEYKGVYILCEQSQINKNRVDVKEAEEGYTGTDIGYFLEIDNYPEENTFTFSTNFGDVRLVDIEGKTLATSTLNVDGRYIHKRTYTIKNDNMTTVQRNFISNYINSVFSISYNAIVNKKYYEFNNDYSYIKTSASKDAKELIGRYVDLRSLVDMYIIQEFSKNTDVGAGSFYMSVDFSENSKRQKLTFECPWDFDWAFNETSRFSDRKKVPYEGLSACTFCSADFAYENNSKKDRSNPWFILFMKADWFRQMVNERYKEILEDEIIEDSIKELLKYQQDFAEDFKKQDNVFVNYLTKAEKISKYYRTQLENSGSVWQNSMSDSIDNLCSYCNKRKTWLKDKFEELSKITGTK